MLGIWLVAKQIPGWHINYDPILGKSIVTIMLPYAGKKWRNTCHNVNNDYLGMGWSGWNLGRNISLFPGPLVLMLYALISQGEVFGTELHQWSIAFSSRDIFFCLAVDFLFFLSRFYLFIHERQRMRERGAETEAGSIQGDWRETRSWVPRITPCAEGSAKLLSHLGCPSCRFSSTTCNSSLLLSFISNGSVLNRTYTCRYLHIKILKVAHYNTWPPSLKFIYLFIIFS